MSVDNFFVSQANLTRRAPVDGDFIFIGQAFFKELNEHPLCPFIVFRRRSIDTSVPIKAKAQRFQLLGKSFNIFLCRHGRVHPGFDGIVFSRQAKSIKAHRIEHIKSLHSFFAGNNIQCGIRARMPHMQTSTGRVREFNQRIKFWFTLIYLNMIGFFIIPDTLPFFFYFFEIITIFQRPFFLPLCKTLFAVKSFIVHCLLSQKIYFKFKLFRYKTLACFKIASSTFRLSSELSGSATHDCPFHNRLLTLATKQSLRNFSLKTLISS